MNEAETRAEHIDPALQAAGWGVVEGSRIRREYAITPGRIEGLGRRGRPLIADYILIYRNTKLAAIDLFETLGWTPVNGTNEVYGPAGTLGWDNRGEMVLNRELRAAIERLNPGIWPEAVELAIEAVVGLNSGNAGRTGRTGMDGKTL